MYWDAICVASGSGTLDSVGINLYATGSGNIQLAIYEGSTLLGHSSTAAATTLWNDLAIPGSISITASTTYKLAWCSDVDPLAPYRTNGEASGTSRYEANTFGDYPSSLPTGTTYTIGWNMRMIYTGGVTTTVSTTTTTSTTGTSTTTTTTTATTGITATSTTSTTTSTTQTSTSTSTTTTSTTGVTRSIPTSYTTLWTSSTATNQIAGTSPYVWQAFTTQKGDGHSKGSIGQRHIASLGDTFAYLAVDNATNYLGVNVWSYSKTGGAGSQGGVFITSLSYDQGYVISDLVSYGSFLWCTVGYQAADKSGIGVSMIKITLPTGGSHFYTVEEWMYFQAAYTTASTLLSVISDCQLFSVSSGRCLVSFSYFDTTVWDCEIMSVNNLFVTSPISITPVDQGTGWAIPNAPKFACDPVTLKVYGLLSPVYIQTYQTGKPATLYDYTTIGSISMITTSTKNPASPAPILYDAEKRMFLWCFFASDYSVVVVTRIASSGVGVEVSMLDPFGSVALGDCLDLVTCGNNNGQFLIYGLWLSGGQPTAYRKTMFVYSTDFGVSWSGWINSPSGTALGLPRRLSIPTKMQQAGFITGSQGYGVLMEYDDGWFFVRMFQYVPNVLTFSGTLTIGALSTFAQTSLVQQVIQVSMTGTKQFTVTTAQYITSDPPITTFSYSALIILSCIASAIVLSRTVFAMLFGAMLGVTIAAATALIPMWFMILILIALVLILVFARQSAGEGDQQL